MPSGVETDHPRVRHRWLRGTAALFVIAIFFVACSGPSFLSASELHAGSRPCRPVALAAPSASFPGGFPTPAQVPAPLSQWAGLESLHKTARALARQNISVAHPATDVSVLPASVVGSRRFSLTLYAQTRARHEAVIALRAMPYARGQAHSAWSSARALTSSGRPAGWSPAGTSAPRCRRPPRTCGVERQVQAARRAPSPSAAGWTSGSQPAAPGYPAAPCP